MRRVLVLGPDAGKILPIVERSGLDLVEDDPEIVLTYGGDGLLLESERRFPGIPKLPLRNSRHGKKCEPHEAKVAIERLLAGDLVRRYHLKVRAEVRGRVLVGLNDVLVHNAVPTSGVRYRVWIDGKGFGGEIVGDGVVVATPFGSTAYYRSITRGIFRVGLGLAFNNSTEQVDHMVLREDAEIRVQITRGPALAAADNDPEPVPLDDGDEVLIRRDEGCAVILGLR